MSPRDIDPVWVEAVRDALARADGDGQGVPSYKGLATDALMAALPLVADAIEAQGREVVQWLAAHVVGDKDMGRLIGTEDAYKDAIRIARCEKFSVESYIGVDQ